MRGCCYCWRVPSREKAAQTEAGWVSRRVRTGDSCPVFEPAVGEQPLTHRRLRLLSGIHQAHAGSRLMDGRSGKAL